MIFSCETCKCETPCCDRTGSYSYSNTEPPGKWYDECPRVGPCGATGDKRGDCWDVTINGYIKERFKKSCIGQQHVRAKLLEGSTLDDFGTIAGIETTRSCGTLGYIIGNHDITESIVWEDDPDDDAFVFAKIPFSASNDPGLGGPVGSANVRICWCCQIEDSGTSPPDPAVSDQACSCWKPQPPVPCCRKVAQCPDGTQVMNCGDASPEDCAGSFNNGNGGLTTITDIIPCDDSGGRTPTDHAPYDCLNGSFNGGAWVTIYGWKAYLGDYADLSERDASTFAILESIVNGSYFVPLPCLSANHNFYLPLKRTETEWCSADWYIAIGLDLCFQGVGVFAGNKACFDDTEIGITGRQQETYDLPCNSFRGCNCQSFYGPIMTYTIDGEVANGRITVTQ